MPFLGWSPLFAAGMVLFVIFREGPTAGRWVVVGLNAALAAVVSAIRTVGSIDAIASGGHVVPAVLALVAVGVVGLVAVVALVPRVRDLDWALLTSLGALTYPLYLTHEYVGWALIEVLHPSLGRWGTLTVAVAGCLGLAWLLHRCVEEPFHRPVRVWLESRLEAAGRWMRGVVRRPAPARAQEARVRARPATGLRPASVPGSTRRP
ncbi:acyltransferase family protein [Salana multivorans]